MKKPTAYAPSALTTFNLFLGFMAVILSIQEQYVFAAWAVIIGGFIDVLDGKVARLADSQSRFGGELDSLADLVTFGLAPAVILYEPVLQDFGKFGIVVGFLYLACGAFRLARFNLEPPKKEKSNFTGLPIPAAAGLLTSFILFTDKIMGEPGFGFSLLILSLMILASILMVSTVEYLCFPKFSWSSPREKVKLFGFLIYFGLMAIYPAYIFFPSGVVYVVGGLIAAMIGYFHPDLPDLEDEMTEAKI